MEYYRWCEIIETEFKENCLLLEEKEKYSIKTADIILRRKCTFHINVVQTFVFIFVRQTY